MSEEDRPPGYWRTCHDIAEGANTALREELVNKLRQIASLEADIKSAWATCGITDRARMAAEAERDELKEQLKQFHKEQL